MRYNTHEHTPRRKTSTTIKVLLALCAILIYGMFALVSFGCFYYGHSIVGGICTILLPLALTLWGLIPMWDMYRAYIEIDGDFIRVVDYYFGFKKEQIYSFSDITSAEIALGNSFRVRGYRMTFAATQYIILKHGKKQLFKIIRLPETETLFKQYICN